MNIENIRKVIDVIRAEQGRNLSMQRYISDCGTVCCLAGHASILAKEEAPEFSLSPVKYSALEFMGIDLYIAEELFLMSSGHIRSMREFDNFDDHERMNMAVWVLENFITTGVVDWAGAADHYGFTKFARDYRECGIGYK